mmetsp:Transcript_37867/g.83159  ORF Transcript_37867/g.83159 Transcript_37867/m.83159 type:complete len:266 (-) Transcript_37867:74-871(-)
MLVRATLKGGEDGLVDLSLEASGILAEEDHTGTRTAERLVSGGSNDVAELERTLLHAGGDEAGNVSHIHQEEGAVGVGNLSELGVVPVAGIGRSAADDHGRLEEGGVLRQAVVIDEAAVGMDAVGEGLEVDRGGRNGLASSLLLGVGVEAVSQMSTRGQIEAHDAIVRFEQSGVNGKVGGRARIRLDVDTPLLGIKTVSLESTLLTESFDLINDFVTAVVTSPGQTLGVFVGKGRTEAFHNRAAGEVFRSDQLKTGPLPVLLLFD